MGTTAEKLTYLNTTKGKIKDSINLTGAGITNQDTFRSYASKLKLGLIDIINNGIDQLYSNFPKVSGIGSNLSLAPTYEAPIKLNEIQGDTSQDGTPTPDTPVEIQSVTGLQNVEINGENLFTSSIVQGAISSNGTFDNTTTTRIRFNDLIPIKKGPYKISYLPNDLQYYLHYYDTSKTHISGSSAWYDMGTFNVAQDGYLAIMFRKSDNSSITPSAISNIKIFDTNTSNTYEVNLGKNLFDMSTAVQSPYGYHNNTGTLTHIDNNTIKIVKENTSKDKRMSVANNINISSGTTISVSWEYGTGNGNVVGQIQAVNNSGSVVNLTSLNNSGLSSPQILTLTDDIKYIYLGTAWDNHSDLVVKNIQIEKGSSSTSYSPYFTPIELNKINTYQDSIKKSTGKNLFDKITALILDGSINNSTNELALATGFKTLIFNCEPNTTYTISKISSSRFNVGLYNENITSSSLPVTLTDVTSNGTATSKTITTNSDTKCIAVMYYRQASDTLTAQQILDSIQIEAGTTPTTYEPYGKVWYIEKQIDKAVYTSSDIANAPRTYNNVKFFTIAKPTNSYMYNNYNRGNLLYTHAIEQITGSLDSADRINKISNVWPETLWVGFNTSTTLETAQQYLNNSILYYPLTTPTYTEITNEELIEQLDNLYTAKSQEGTTNISITSEYLPFILNISALEMTD